MRALARAALAALAAAGIAAAALALWLPRYVASPAFEARLRAAAHDASGRDVEWRALSVGLWPPRFVASGVRVAAGGAQPPALEADRVELRLALLPLLARAFVVDSLAIDGATLRLVRGASGLALAGSLPAAAGDPQHGGGGPSLAVRDLRVAGSRAVFEDRSVAPPASIEVVDLAGRARGAAIGAPIAVDVSGRLAGGGTLRAEGQLGPLDLELTLDGVALAPFAPWLGKNLRLGAGSVSGTLRARGPLRFEGVVLRAPEQLDTELHLADADLRVGEVGVRGPVDARAELRVPGDVAAAPDRPAGAAGVQGGYAGTFSIDATAAELVYGGAFRKPPGAPATADGKLASQPDGKLGVESVKLSIKRMGGQGSLAPERGPRIVLEEPGSLDADLEGLLADPGHPLAGARGRISFAAGKGRFPGVSPLGLLLAKLGELGDVVPALADGHRKLERLEGDEFESIRSELRVADGRAHVDELDVRYPGYVLGLRGSLGLVDEGLDLVGSFTPGETLDAALGAEGSARGRTLALARVRGTVSEPRIEVEREAALAFAAGMALGSKRSKLERKLDKRLGQGSGRQLLDTLGGFLALPPGKERD